MPLPFIKRKEEDADPKDLKNNKKDPKAPVKKRKSRKKEKDKPWTSRERFLVLGVLLTTIIISVYLALSARDFKLPNLPRLAVNLKLPEFLNLEQTFVIENKNKTTPDQLVKDFQNLTKSHSGVYGFYVEDLGSHVSHGLYQDEVFQAASVIKLPVMIALYQQKPEGYQQLVEDMGKRSDNAAFKKARLLLGDRVIQETIYRMGLTKTSLADNETTPAEVATIFKLLYNHEILPAEDSEAILNALTDTIYEDHLAAGIPEGIRVAHKYGREVHVVADGGIVYTDHPFITVIMSKGVIESEADLLFPELSKLIYEVEISQ